MHDMYPNKQNGWWHRRTLDGLGHAQHSYSVIGRYGTYSYTDDSGAVISKYYRNFKVAQHSKDYHAWTSSDTNGWEKLDGSAKFAIVRRNAVA